MSAHGSRRVSSEWKDLKPGIAGKGKEMKGEREREQERNTASGSGSGSKGEQRRAKESKGEQSRAEQRPTESIQRNPRIIHHHINPLRMLPGQKRREIQNALRPTDIEPVVPDRRLPAMQRQRLGLLQPRVALERPDGVFAPAPVPGAQVDEQGAPVVEGRGAVLQREVADDGEADAFVRAGHGGDAGGWGHGVLGVEVRWRGVGGINVQIKASGSTMTVT